MNKHLEKGIQQLYTGNLIEAESSLNKAFEDEPLNPEVYFYRGKVYWQGGNLNLAMNDFQKALEINPHYNQARVSLEMVQQILSFRNPSMNNP
jgi:Tfp pilus assembly protein PilF